MKKPHTHADLIIAWAEDTSTLFQSRDNLNPHLWHDCTINTVLAKPHINEFRVKPKTIYIGDREIVAPIRLPLELGQPYWKMALNSSAKKIQWNNDSVDNVWLAAGILFLTEDDANEADKAIRQLLAK